MRVRNPATISAIVAYGDYVGDGTQNRAIAHGLGAIPGLVIINTTDEGGTPVYNQAPLADNGRLYATGIVQAVTNADATSFYVGSAAFHANTNLKQYYWTAIRT